MLALWFGPLGATVWRCLGALTLHVKSEQKVGGSGWNAYIGYLFLLLLPTVIAPPAGSRKCDTYKWLWHRSSVYRLAVYFFQFTYLQSLRPIINTWVTFSECFIHFSLPTFSLVQQYKFHIRNAQQNVKHFIHVSNQVITTVTVVNTNTLLLIKQWPKYNNNNRMHYTMVLYKVFNLSLTVVKNIGLGENIDFSILIDSYFYEKR